VLKVKVFIAAFLVSLSGAAVADHLSEHSVEERIKPSGSVYVEGDDVPVAKPAVIASTGPRTGESIYTEKCAACHATDAIGAPMFGNPESWATRLSKGEEAIINNAINGINAMPPMGTCTDCSNEEIAETVKYMLENSK
jgi:cytochrome c5